MNKLTLPVLILPQVVFFPKTSLPLIVQDKLCITMLKKCIENGSPIALALGYDPESGPIYPGSHSICSYGKVIFIEETSDGGYLKVLIRGIGKLELGQIIQNLPYPIYEAYPVHDKPEQISLHFPSIENLQNKLHEWAYQHIGDSLEREHFLQQLTGVRQLVDYVCMLLIKDVEIKQMLLSNNSLFERIGLLNSLLRHPSLLIEDQEVARAMKTYEYLEDLPHELYH